MPGGINEPIQMRHAYLIIAHNEFEVLDLLVSKLDDERNDIFIHFDRKVKELPRLTVVRSTLHILENRVDVRWGDVSQIKCEMVLFEYALAHGPYDYYHLISGTHLPLTDNDGIDRFFAEMNGASVMAGMVTDTGYQETLKMRRINLFTRTYASRNQILSRCSQFLWRSFIAVQRILNIRINKSASFYKASNWVSLTDEAVRLIVSRKKLIFRKYRFSLCGDEFFVPTELMDSPLKEKIMNNELLLKREMLRANPRVYHLDELEGLKESGCVFARKFTIR